ncbi:MAG: hypothetical protein BGO88_02970 [Flavobacterium sp. 38-13]|nr:MAG: hypothetical protein BGO88_02970 [Flavobacterium sp. 38-13]
MKKTHILLIAGFMMASCEKQEKWLDVKSNKSDVVPTTLQDYRALLDNDQTLNESEPALGFIGSDNYYITDAVYTSLSGAYLRNSYTWSKEIYEGGIGFDWRASYQHVGIANVVLDGLKKIDKAQNTSEYNSIKGDALFIRAKAFFNLASQFAKQYDKETADTDLGIVLKMTSAVQEKVSRSTVLQTYQQIIDDLLEAESILPSIAVYKTRASKSAARGLLAKVYLSIGDYVRALKYSNAVLEQDNVLIDFNNLNAALAFPFPTFAAGNPEVVYHCIMTGVTISTNSRMLVPDFLYQMYDTDDLRKTLFFNTSIPSQIKFKGYYTGENSAIFCGIALNEMYLISAECEARNGNKDASLQHLNKLLNKRYRTGSFTALSAADAKQALAIVLRERRKEIPFNGISRWIDLRRLNKERDFAVELSRTVRGTVYSIPPNDPRYIYPIPPEEIRVTGIQQNIR